MDNLRHSLKRRALLKPNSSSPSGNLVESGQMFRAERPTAKKPSLSDLKAKEYEELAARDLPVPELDHPDPSFIRSPKRQGILFEQVPLSPWSVSLDGKRSTLDNEGTPDTGVVFGITGLCPICNNAQHRELDAALIHSLWTGRPSRGLPFTSRDVLEHVIRHIGPVYSEVGSSASPQNIAAMAAGNGNPGLGDRIAANIRSAIRRLRFLARDDRQWDEEDQYEIPVFEELIDWDAEEQPASQEAREIRARPPGVKGTQWYAFDGGTQMGELRKWGEERTDLETQKRSDDAIVFYDEMLRSRRMAMRVYDEIMDEQQMITRHDKSGNTWEEPVPKNYGAAINAAKLVKDVAMDLMKLALISSKMGDATNAARTLSPAIQDMISDLGIFDKPEPADTSDAEVLQ